MDAFNECELYVADSVQLGAPKGPSVNPPQCTLTTNINKMTFIAQRKLNCSEMNYIIKGFFCGDI